MALTMRERILSVYDGNTPDVIPFMLDLSHWFYEKNRLQFDFGIQNHQAERDLIAYHRKAGAGFYMINNVNVTFYSVSYGPGVSPEVKRDVRDGIPEVSWSYASAGERILRTRVWEPKTYSWPTKEWGVKTKEDLAVLGDALGARTYSPDWDAYESWCEHVGGAGIIYMPAGYSAMGHLLNYWMGVEGTLYAIHDWPELMHETVDRINDNNLHMIDMLASCPAEVITMGDNFSSDVQPPHLFDEWSRPYYAEAIRRLHAAGKRVAVHIDGRLRGALRMIREAGADCADAVTPPPIGDLDPEQCRSEAGDEFILSGGVSPDLWLPSADVEDFKRAVREWLDLKRHGPRLIAAAGDQVPPGAVEDRIEIMRDMVEQYGSYG